MLEAVIVVAIVIAAGGVGFGLWFAGRAIRAEKGLVSLESRLNVVNRTNAELQAEAARHEAALESERRNHEAQIEQLQKETAKKIELVAGTRKQIADEVKAANADVLKDATEQLMTRAEEARKADRELTAGELKARAEEIQAKLSPIEQVMENLGKQVQTLEQDRKRTEGQVTQMFQNVQSVAGDLRMETSRLVTALRRPNVRGSWGEMQLKGVVRAAGMTEHVDFHSQPVLEAGPDGRLRPDMTVHLPSERDLVVDSKVPLDAYLDAIEATEDSDGQAAHLDRHARQVRGHIDRLASKAYHAQLDTQAEFVVCFLPNEAVYCAALDRDPGLLQHGAAKRVLIATPTTLLALLYACAYGWQQAAIEESAREIAAAGRELHRRFGVFFTEFLKTGRMLSRTVNSYNAASASAEARLLPQLRRIAESGASSEKEIPTPRQLDTPPRLVSAPEVDEVDPVDTHAIEPDTAHRAQRAEADEAGPGKLPPAEAA